MISNSPKPEVAMQEEADDLAQRKLALLDTVHGDEAVKVLAFHTGPDTWDPSEEKRLVRKIDRKLLTILCLTYGLQYYDKAMLSQAAIFGLRKDLHLTTGNRYSFASAIFYLGFMIGTWPAVFLAQRYPIERVASGILIVWAGVLLATVGCHNYQALYAQRFFLGFIESGISPMFMLVVGGWYKKQEQALRMSAWYSCTGFASAVSPLINYGLGHITSGTLQPWQYMYLFASILTFLWGVAVYFILPPDPIRAKGFTDRERYIAVARMRQNNTGVRNTHFKWKQVLDTATDIRFWVMFAFSFLCLIANGPVSSFIPIFINDFGFNQLNSLLLTVPAGIVAGCTELGFGYLAYKLPGRRTYLMFLAECISLLAALLMWKLPRSARGGQLYACYTLALFGAAYGVAMGLQVANTAGYTKRSVTSSGLFMGYCLGNFVGPLLFKPEDSPGYAPGFIATAAASAGAAALALIYRFFCIWENKRRDKSGLMEGYDHAYEDDLTDRKNPQFRYTT